MNYGNDHWGSKIVDIKPYTGTVLPTMNDSVTKWNVHKKYFVPVNISSPHVFLIYFIQ